MSSRESRDPAIVLLVVVAAAVAVFFLRRAPDTDSFPLAGRLVPPSSNASAAPPASRVEIAGAAGTEVDAVPESETGVAGDLVGVVVDEHELPIEHACVQLRALPLTWTLAGTRARESPGVLREETRTGATGAFAFQVAEEDRELGLLVSAAGFKGRLVTGVVVPGRHVVTLERSPWRITGVVRDAGTGRPIPAATVTLADTREEASRGTAATTDAHGRFELADLSRGLYFLEAAHPLYYQSRDLFLMDRGDRDVSILLRPAATFTARVVDRETRESIPGARVSDGRRVVTTDPGGEFTFAGGENPGQAILLEIRREDYGTQAIAVPPGAMGRLAQDLELSRPVPYRVRIRTEDSPVPELATVSFWYQEGGIQLEGAAFRRESGTLLVESDPLPSGKKVRAVACAPGYAKCSGEARPGDQDPGELLLRRGVEVSGRVRDEAGRRVANALVVVEPQESRLALFGKDGTGIPRLDRLLQAQHVQRTDLGGGYVFHGIAAGRHDLVVYARGHELLRQDLELDVLPGVPVQRDLTLIGAAGEPGWIRGTAYDPVGPWEHVKVVALNALGDRWFTWTDEEGRFALELPWDDYALVAIGVIDNQWRNASTPMEFHPGDTNVRLLPR